MLKAWEVAQFIWSHPANHRRRLRAIIRALAWQLYKRITGHHLDLRVFNGLRLRCYPDSTSASSAIYCHAYPDYHEMGFMEHYLRPGDAFLDVGANIGLYTLLAASLLAEQGIVDSFEPDRKALGRLHENIAINHLNQVRVHAKAVGNTNGRVRFLREHDVTNRILMNGEIENPVVIVPCVRLDDFLGGRHYAMGKMDIEGAEMLALRGAENMIAVGNPPVWLLEMNKSLKVYGFSEHQVKNWLEARGYELALYNRESRVLSFDGRPWQKRANVLAICQLAKERVLARLET